MRALIIWEASAERFNCGESGPSAMSLADCSSVLSAESRVTSD